MTLREQFCSRRDDDHLSRADVTVNLMSAAVPINSGLWRDNANELFQKPDYSSLGLFLHSSKDLAVSPLSLLPPLRAKHGGCHHIPFLLQTINFGIIVSKFSSLPAR